MRSRRFSRCLRCAIKSRRRPSIWITPGEGCDLDYVPNARASDADRIRACPIRLGSVAPTVRSFSADLEPLTAHRAVSGQLSGTAREQRAAGAGQQRRPVRHSAHGERRVSAAWIAIGACPGPHARDAAGFLAARSRTGGRRCALPPMRRRSAVHRRLAACTWATSWRRKSSRACGCRRAPTPWPRLAIRAPAAWIRDRATGQAWLVAEPGYEALLDRIRGSTCERARRPPAASRRRRFEIAGGGARAVSRVRAPGARVHRRGRCVSGQSVAAVAGPIATARDRSGRRSTSVCAPPIPVRSRR